MKYEAPFLTDKRTLVDVLLVVPVPLLVVVAVEFPSKPIMIGDESPRLQQNESISEAFELVTSVLPTVGKPSFGCYSKAPVSEARRRHQNQACR